MIGRRNSELSEKYRKLQVNYNYIERCLQNLRQEYKEQEQILSETMKLNSLLEEKIRKFETEKNTYKQKIKKLDEKNDILIEKQIDKKISFFSGDHHSSVNISAFEKYNDQFLQDFGYSPAEKIKNQIIKAYKNGHDIQLHIHPQFREMTYKKGRFILKDSYKSMIDFSKKEAFHIIQEAKNRLYSIIESNH